MLLSGEGFMKYGVEIMSGSMKIGKGVRKFNREGIAIEAHRQQSKFLSLLLLLFFSKERD